MNSRRACLIFILLLCSSAASIVAELFDPPVVYLTWLKKPETTMSIQWIIEANQEQENAVSYREAGKTGWLMAMGKSYQLPSDNKYLLHRVELTELEPNTEYRFKIGVNGVEYKFRTMPSSLHEPIRFVEGGDMYHDDIEYAIETNKAAAKFDPHFALAGGDLAYAVSGKAVRTEQTMDRWMTWLKAWKKHMVAPDGRLIPIIAVIGNHDVTGGFDQTPAQAEIFYRLFRGEGQTGYGVMDFGSYLSVFILDTGHTNPVSAQVGWLNSALSSRKDIPHKIAIYHVPAYPSVRPYGNERSSSVRQYWVPLFEKYQVDLAFEHHDHTYKRTYPLLKGRISPYGVIYLGDGSWGVEKPRNPQKRLYYLAKSASVRNFIGVTLQDNGRLIQAVDSQGHLIDSFKQALIKKPQPAGAL